VFRGLRGGVSRFFAADGFFLSAGLAFFFLVCLIPLTLIGVSVVGFVLSTQEAAETVVGQFTRNFPVYRREVSRVLLRIVETRRVSGLLGTVVLIFFSTPLFSASRLVLHRLLGIRTKANIFRSLLVDMGTVLLLAVLLFAATVVTWVYDWFSLFVLEPARLPRQWLNTGGVALSVALSTAMFYLAYRYVPRHRIRPGAALAGAVMASVLWEIAKQLFRLYIRKIGIYDQINVPFGILIGYIMFVYYSAVVFVFGAAYAAAVDSRRR
jgi:YihY family inner membrane protein